ncbi:MAG: cellulase family glycosylhydrolase [Polyangiaceae bacterium]
MNYASDVPNPNLGSFKTLFTNVYNAGGRVIRWWFHTDGSVTPGYTNGEATPISQADISAVKSILDAAYSAGVAVNISIWSFDMLNGGNANIPVANNLNLLTNDTDRQAYITNVLTPLVTALKGYHGLYSWEVFNEPEGMTTQNGWTTCKSTDPSCGTPAGGQEIDEKYVQICVNWFADAIHTADPNALVTNGAWTFLANSNVVGTNYYSDSALLAAGGRSKGTLDYYQVHYYDNWGTPGGAESVSPFQNKASYWGLTDGKPIVIGEFWAIDTYADGTSSKVLSSNLYTTLYTEGYGGAWAWQYANADNPGPSDYPTDSEQTTWGPLMQTAMQNLYNADQAAVLCQ